MIEQGTSVAGCPIRVLYSFPGKIGADRIDFTASQRMAGLMEAGAATLRLLYRTLGLASLSCPRCARTCGGAWKALLVYRIGDVQTRTENLTMLDEQPDTVECLRTRAIQTAKELTSERAGSDLLAAYRFAVGDYTPVWRLAASGTA